MMPLSFEWDPEKSRQNLLKHGIGFEEARRLWERPVVEGPTYAGSDGERSVVTGTIDGKHWTAVITHRHGAVRIISVRRARKREVEAYALHQGRFEGDLR